MTSQSEMGDRIVKAMKDKGGKGISFVELSNAVEGFDGDYGLEWGEEDSNIFLWMSMSKEAINAFQDLFKEGIIEVASTHPLVYIIDGRIPKHPIAKRINHKYKKPRWLPVAMALVGHP